MNQEERIKEVLRKHTRKQLVLMAERQYLSTEGDKEDLAKRLVAEAFERGVYRDCEDVKKDLPNPQRFAILGGITEPGELH